MNVTYDRHVGITPARDSFYDRLLAHGRLALLDAPPPKELRRADFLVGEWRMRNVRFATEALVAAERDVEGVIGWSPALGGHAYMSMGDGPRPGMQLIAFDRAERQWVEVSVEPNVTFQLNRSPGWSGRELVFEVSAKVLAEHVVLRHRLVHLDDDHWKWANDEWIGDWWVPIDEHRMTRVGAPEPAAWS